jgi:hypothetical protein
VDPRAHGPELDAQRGRDLLVAEALDVTQDDGGPELRRERVERGLHVVVQMRVLVDPGRVGFATGDSLVRVVAERVEADPLLAPYAVQEEVRGDPVEPALEGSGGVRRPPG